MEVGERVRDVGDGRKETEKEGKVWRSELL